MTRRRIPPGFRSVAFVMPDAASPRLTDAERLALEVRNAATSSGRCACGATWDIPDGLESGDRVAMEHEDDCPAISGAAISGAHKLAAAARWEKR